MTHERHLRRETIEIWDAKAAYWDERMGEGNAFHRQLVGPAIERLLLVRPGERVLEIACGNGQLARRLAELGAVVLATDASARFLELARARTAPEAAVTYQQLDATDAGALAALGEGRFDAAVCAMALMDIPDIAPLAQALPRLLRPGGRMVFALSHPCFNAPSTRLSIEEEDRDGTLVERRWVSMHAYLSAQPQRGAGMPGEPLPHWYFPRPLSGLLAPFFAAGLVLDGLEEPAFPEPIGGQRALSWDAFPEIPPVLAGRLRHR